MEQEKLTEIFLKKGAATAKQVEVAEIPFSADLRKLCINNVCGGYGKSWACPPGAGEIEALIEEVRSYASGIVFQTIVQMEDSYDVESMQEGGKKHNELARTLRGWMLETVPRVLALGLGGCGYCKTCTYPDEACRAPEQKLSSMEAYGIHCERLLHSVGLKYHNGENTISYVGLILYD